MKAVVRPSLAEDATDEAFAEAMVRCQAWAPACCNGTSAALLPLAMLGK